VGTRYIKGILVHIIRGDGDEKVSRRCKVPVHSFTLMDLWMRRSDDSTKSPDRYKPMGLGRYCSDFRDSVKVKVTIQETRMRLDSDPRALQLLAPKMRMFTQSLICNIIGSKTETVDLD
jgi:hypothetical protein